MNPTSDDKQRARALTDLDSTMLVEASAGTGKTSLLAGRVAMLLADNRPASSVAAITFTERAAAGLRVRVEEFADALVADNVPKDLEPAFRDKPLTVDQRAHLAHAKDQLGDLTACTIHAFCLSILQSYAVEARIDPGAAVMDADQTDLAFESILDAWLNERLGNNADAADPIAVMAADNPSRAVRTLRNLAGFRRAHTEVRPAPAASYADDVHDYVDAVSEYRRWISRFLAPDTALRDVGALEDLAELLAPARSGALSFPELLRLLHPESPILPARRPGSYDDSRVLFAYRPRSGLWTKATDAIQGPLLAAEDQAHYERCARLFRGAMGAMADALLAQYFDQTNSLMQSFEDYKLSAALLDFDDILVRTRRLLADNPRVRAAVAERYRHVLVDEFQDTDPIQTEILLLLCGDDDKRLRPGALFLVGDPKQAIYRFRGADLPTYLRTRDLIEAQFPGNVLLVSANFRSEARILKYVDRTFAERLRKQLGDYGELDPTVIDDKSLGVRKHSFPTQQDDGARNARQVEAKEIADLCAALVGNIEVRRSNGDIVLCEPGDIALLAPARTDLWLYERALEDKGLAVASQAGKNLYLRQETQDVVALVRALADSRDTLALGALLRGPLVGLTEHQLLDVTRDLRTREPGAVLRLRKDAPPIGDENVRRVMDILQDLWRKRRGTTPHTLLSEALERLRAIPSMALRSLEQRGRTLANLQSLLERSRAYHVRGLKQLAIDLSVEWDRGIAFDEAPADHPGNSVDVVTIHKAKGLEWPVVIPINLVSMSRRTDEFFHRLDDNSVHWTLGDVASSTLEIAIAADADAMRKESERLLYVACTRALDLLIIPNPTEPRKESWFTFFDLGQDGLEPIHLPKSLARPPAPSTGNNQTAAGFVADAESIAASAPTILWRRPSMDDADRELLDQVAEAGEDDAVTTEPSEVTIGAGTRRGIILHRLMEELILGQVLPELDALIGRAAALTIEAPDDGAAMPLAEQLAATALRVFSHDALASFRGQLMAEVSLYGARSATELVSARADAVAIDDGRAVAAFDWKSNINPTDAQRREHKAQLAQYLQLIHAPRGAVVYMTTPEFHWIAQDGSDSE
jgi:ATP-dependent exoDNAse (exonuclease V) beta subunit